MHQFFDSAEDVIAVKVEGKITGADLDAVMDRMDSVMGRHPKFHMFVETSAIDGMGLSGLSSYAARAMPLFGKLTHFGRVAVVADQTWVRAASRIESAALPFISYRVFEPDQRAEALAWVKGGPTGEAAAGLPPGP